MVLSPALRRIGAFLLALLICIAIMFSCAYRVHAEAITAAAMLVGGTAAITSIAIALGLVPDTADLSTFNDLISRCASAAVSAGLTASGYVRMWTSAGVAYAETSLVNWVKNWFFEQKAYNVSTVAQAQFTDRTYGGYLAVPYYSSYVWPNSAVPTTFLTLSTDQSIIWSDSLPFGFDFYATSTYVHYGIWYKNVSGQSYGLYGVNISDSHSLSYVGSTLSVSYPFMVCSTASSGTYGNLYYQSVYGTGSGVAVSKTLGLNNSSFVFSTALPSITSGWSTTDSLPSASVDVDTSFPAWSEKSIDIQVDGVSEAVLPVSVPTVADGTIVADPTLDQTAAQQGTITDAGIDAGVNTNTSVENTSSVAESQSIVDSVVGWAVGYISPDTGLFSKFPFSIPYDLYLFVSSMTGTVGTESATTLDPGAVSLDTSELSFSADYTASAAGWVPIVDTSIHLDLVNIDVPIHLDFTPFDWFFRVTKVGYGVLYTIGLLNWVAGRKDED